MDERTEQRFKILEERLTQLERMIGVRAPIAAPSAQTQPMPQAAAAPTQRQAEPSSETSSSRALGTVSAICFVLAGSYIIKLAIDSGWLTPLRQLLLAILFGITLIGAGFALREKDRKYASYLPGAGIAILFACAITSHTVFQLLSFENALATLALVSVGCVAIHREFREVIYSLIAAGGSYLLPLLLGASVQDPFTVNVYYLLCSMVFSHLASWAGSRSLTLVSSYLAMGITSFLSLGRGQEASYAFLILSHFLIQAWGVVQYSVKRKSPLTRIEAYAYFPVLLFFYGIEYHFLNPIFPGLVHWMGLIFAAVLILLERFARNRLPEGQSLASRDLIVSTSMVAVFHSIYLGFLPEAFHPLFMMLMLLAALLTGMSPGATLPFSRAIGGLLFAWMLFSNFFLILLNQSRGEGYWTAYGFLMTFTLGFTYLRLSSKISWGRVNDVGSLFLIGAHLQAILSLYHLVRSHGSFAVSASWAIYAAMILGIGFSRHDRIFAKSSLVILIAASGKALLYDVGAASAGVRILCLILTGVLLYSSGMLLKKVESWSQA